jgi:hypothetical protein
MDLVKADMGDARQFKLCLAIGTEAGVYIKKCFKFLIFYSYGVFSRIDRNGAESNSRKSALSALYLAARRLLSEPCMTACPSVVHTHHRHVARPRFFKTMSKTGN